MSLTAPTLLHHGQGSVRYRYVGLVCGALALAGCGRDDGGERYFPLAPGIEWQYRVERTTMDGERDLRYVISTMRPSRVRDMVAAARQTSDGQRYYYDTNDDGIFRIGAHRRDGDTFVDDRQRAMVLPARLAPAATWQARTHTAVLENSGPPWETVFRISVPVDIHYRVDSLSATIETPAGTFTDCLVVSGHGKTNADVGNYIGPTEIEIATTEWFAPGVGLVRLERSERTAASAIKFGSLTMELDRWRED